MIVYLNQVVGPSALMELQNPFLSKLAVIVGHVAECTASDGLGSF